MDRNGLLMWVLPTACQNGGNPSKVILAQAWDIEEKTVASPLLLLLFSRLISLL